MKIEVNFWLKLFSTIDRSLFIFGHFLTFCFSRAIQILLSTYCSMQQQFYFVFSGYFTGNHFINVVLNIVVIRLIDLWECN